jgi:hypothetical protein
MKRSGLLLICGLLLVAPAARAGDLTIPPAHDDQRRGQSSTREEMCTYGLDVLVIDSVDTRTIVDGGEDDDRRGQQEEDPTSSHDLRRHAQAAEAVRSRVAKMPADVRKMLRGDAGERQRHVQAHRQAREDRWLDASEQELSGGPFHGLDLDHRRDRAS